MKFAIAIPTDADSWRLVRRAEELGFSRAWFYDTQMLSADPFVAMAAAAIKTAKIRLGTGVLIPSNRLAAVAANAFASLNKLAPGRIDFGVGTGFTGRRAMGLSAVRLADMEEYLRVVTGLLAGETIEAKIEGKTRLIRLLNPELGLINTRDPIGLYVAATGPRAQALTARLGAGWISTIGDPAAANAALREMRSGREAAGHGADALDSVVLTGGAILEEGEPADSPRAIAQAGPRAAMLLHRAADAALAGVPEHHAGPAFGRRDRRPICRIGAQLPAARRALSRKPPRPSDVRQARGAPVRHRRADPPDHDHRHRTGSQKPPRRPLRRRLQRGGTPDRPRPGACTRRLGQNPPRLRVSNPAFRRPRLTVSFGFPRPFLNPRTGGPFAAYALTYAKSEASVISERHVKLFKNGRNQAVRIPREFELPGEDAIMRKEGERLIIEPAPPKSLLALLATLAPLDEEFPAIPDTAPDPIEL